MAANKKGGGAFKAPAREYDSVLLRSAESLGRMIGALQRQIDTMSKRLGSSDGDGDGHHHADGDGWRGDGDGRRSPNGGGKPAPKPRKKASASRPKVSAGARKHSAAKPARKSTRPR
jgi:hypothetical protein